MLTSLIKNNPQRVNETLFLGILSLICFGLSVLRFVYTDTKVFLFLNWNLFLAFVPWLLTSIAILRPNLKNHKITNLFLLFSWLLFFPNAPYIFTDLFHLKTESSMPIWFDLILILSFAWTGLLFGFLSLLDIEKRLKQTLTTNWVTLISVVLLFIASFGIYIGRYLRWNSWDIINDPYALVFDISDRIINPFEHPRTWGMTLFMGLFLNMMYWSFRFMRKKEISYEK